MKVRLILCFVLTLTLGVSTAQAGYATHTGSANPTTESWTWDSQGMTAATLAGGTDTLDYWGMTGAANEGGGYAASPTSMELLSDWRFSSIMKVVSNVPSGGIQGNVSMVAADSNTFLNMKFGEGANGVWQYQDDDSVWQTLATLDTSAYHRYDVVFDADTNGTVNGNKDTYTFYVDSEQVAQVKRKYVRDHTFDSIFWGDVSEISTSESRWNLVEFSNDLTIPPPGGGDPPGPDLSGLDRGHRILIEKGFQAATMTSPWGSYNPAPTQTYWDAMAGANFTTAYMSVGAGEENIPDIPDGQQWGVLAQGNWTMPEEDVPTLVMIQYRDEPDLNDRNVRNDQADQQAIYRAAYPDVISYTNIGGGITDRSLSQYMSKAKPDMVSFDQYPFQNNGVTWPVRDYYEHLARYRDLALAGHGDAGAQGVPYAVYVQAYQKGPTDRIQSESEVNMNHYAAWAFGYKVTNAFVFDHAQIDPYLSTILFGENQDETTNYSQTTTSYGHFADVNAEGQNLGHTLEALWSTDVRMITGYDLATPDGMTEWDNQAGHDASQAYITSIDVANQGSLMGGEDGDVIVGYFKVLLESFDGDNYTDETYFMIVNALTDVDATAAEAVQEITLNFDFGASGITELERLNRSTGNVDTVSLTHVSGSVYQYVFDLDGGEGDLFKYNTGATFVQMPEPTTLVVLGLGCFAVLIRRSRRSLG